MVHKPDEIYKRKIEKKDITYTDMTSWKLLSPLENEILVSNEVKARVLVATPRDFEIKVSIVASQNK